MGQNRYNEAFQGIRQVQLQLIEYVTNHIPGLAICGEPIAGTVALMCDSSSSYVFDVYLLASLMEDKGWNLFTSQGLYIYIYILKSYIHQVVPDVISA